MAKKVSSERLSSLAGQYMKDPNPHIRALAASVLTQDETPGSARYEQILKDYNVVEPIVVDLPEEPIAEVRKPVPDMQLVLQGDGGIRPVAPADMDVTSFAAGFYQGYWRGLWKR